MSSYQWILLTYSTGLAVLELDQGAIHFAPRHDTALTAAERSPFRVISPGVVVGHFSVSFEAQDEVFCLVDKRASRALQARGCPALGLVSLMREGQRSLGKCLSCVVLRYLHPTQPNRTHPPIPVYHEKWALSTRCRTFSELLM